MIFLFLIDTSASMNQRNAAGMSLLDCAKSACEYFMGQRSRDPSARTDRYLLVTTEDGVGAIKAGWRDSPQTFIAELKNLKALDLGDLGSSIKKSFDLLNLARLNTDNYGQGRAPWLAEQTYIFVFTDGSQLVDAKGVQTALTIPQTPHSPGQELNRDIFRWDQRLYSFVLRMSPHSTGAQSNQAAAQTAATQKAPNQAVINTLGSLSDATGGKLHVVMSIKQISGIIDGIVARTPAVGVAANFEPLAVSPIDARSLPINVERAPPTSHKTIYCRPGPPASWPLPEDMTLPMQSYPASSISFFPTESHRDEDRLSSRRLGSASTAGLYFRVGQPTIRYNPAPVMTPHHPGDFSIDRYVIEQSPMSEWMIATCNALASSPEGSNYMFNLTGSQAPINRDFLCFECCIQPAALEALSGSSGSSNQPPSPYFGFLKPHFESNSVHLWVLPYNYGHLFSLLNRWNNSGTQSWRDEWTRYIKSVPSYYIPYLHAAFGKWKPPSSAGMSFTNPPANIGSLMSDLSSQQNIFPVLHPALSSHLKAINRQLKEESDKLDAALEEHRRNRALLLGNSVPISKGPSFSYQISSIPSTPGGVGSGAPLLYSAPPVALNNSTSSIIVVPDSKSQSGSKQVTPAGSAQATPSHTPAPAAAMSQKALSPLLASGMRLDLFSVPTDELMLYLESIATAPATHQPKQPQVAQVWAKATENKPAIQENGAFSKPEVPEVTMTESKSHSQERNRGPQLEKPAWVDPRFRVPIADMGNYQEVLAKQKPLRNPLIDDEDPRLSVGYDPRLSGRSFFGNPYARKMKQTPGVVGTAGSVTSGVLVDEADVSAGDVAAFRSNGGGGMKRKSPPGGVASEKDAKTRRKGIKITSASTPASPVPANATPPAVPTSSNAPTGADSAPATVASPSSATPSVAQAASASQITTSSATQTQPSATAAKQPAGPPAVSPPPSSGVTAVSASTITPALTTGAVISKLPKKLPIPAPVAAPPVPTPAPLPAPTVLSAPAPSALSASTSSLLPPSFDSLLSKSTAGTLPGIEMLAIRRHNNQIKFSVIEFIRQPISKESDSKIVDQLRKLTGDLAMKRRIVKEVQNLAKQFKRSIRIPSDLF